MSKDVLPDSRTKDRKGSFTIGDKTYVPIYCINCGRSCGVVPEKLITHVTALCDHGCAGKYGDLASQYEDPDAVFHRNLGEALGSESRQVTLQELEAMAEDPTPALAAALKDWQNRVSKENK